MDQHLLKAFVAATAVTAAGWGTAFAQDGQPHSLQAKAVFNNVQLSWKAPSAPIALQWHDNEAYNGLQGQLTSPDGTAVLYTGVKYSADDLKDFAGQQVDSLVYYEYRQMFSVTLLVYEDGKQVREQAVDLSNFKKDSWRAVKLASPLTVKAGTELTFVLKFETGRNNNDFVSLFDRQAHPGKNIYSYDGKTWKTDVGGDFNMGIFFHNNTAAPTSGKQQYKVLRDGAPVAIGGAETTDATTATLTGEPEGEHTYTVEAEYAGGPKKSSPVTLTLLKASSSLPPVPVVRGSASGLAGHISWAEPLKRGKEMTWSNKQPSTGVGGTSKSSPKIWVTQKFSTEDLAAFPDNEITAINAYFVQPKTEAQFGITDVKLFIQRNDTTVYTEELGEEEAAKIKPNEWHKFTLKTPFKLEPGNEYAYGYYIEHLASTHPAGIDSSEGVEERGNSFSTTSISSSKGFAGTKPSWKTLGSGKIKGNFLLTADVKALSADASKAQTIASYDVYRNGQKIAEALKDTAFNDNVKDLGAFTYTVVANGADGKKSTPTPFELSYTLPEEYRAPVVFDYNQDGAKIDFSYSSDAYELKHYDTPSHIASMQEEFEALWGSKYSAAELAPYAGYELKNIKFGIGAACPFTLRVMTNGGKTLWSKSYATGDIQPGYLYTLTFDKDEKITVPAGRDLYLAYDAVIPASSAVMIFDDGPAEEGGAVVSLDKGKRWYDMSTIVPSVKDYNVVISGLIAAPAKETAAKAKDKRTAMPGGETLTRVPFSGQLVPRIAVADEFGAEQAFVAPQTSTKAAAAAAATQEKPKVKAYRVYRNNSLLKETSETTFAETLPSYGLFNYYVTSVFENGWESPASEGLVFSNTIRQLTQAPYNLEGTRDGNVLKLSWQPTSKAPELAYYDPASKALAYGMTGNGEREGYHAIRFKPEEMSDKVGQEVTHIKFRLNSDQLTSASVFVMYDENIVYEQALESVVAGWNGITLNKPVSVPAGVRLGVGYHITYESGVKPFIVDQGPAVAGYGDLISSSAAAGYWYSLKSKYKVDGNYLISAVLQAPAQHVGTKAVKAAADAAVTYNVYLDGTLIKSGLTATSFAVADAKAGSYTVSAVTGDKESGQSNAVVYGQTTGIEGIDADTTAPTSVYGVDGRRYDAGTNSNYQGTNLNGLSKGIYIIGGKKIVVK